MEEWGENGGKKDKNEKRTGTCVEEKKRGKKKKEKKRKKCRVWRIKKEGKKKRKEGNVITIFSLFFYNKF